MVIHAATSTVKIHTMLGDVLPTWQGYHLSLTWMFTDFEFNFRPKGFQPNEPVFLSGTELDSLIKSQPFLQMIWGVCSGFRLPVGEIDRCILPEATDPNVWNPDYKIQHP